MAPGANTATTGTAMVDLEFGDLSLVARSLLMNPSSGATGMTLVLGGGVAFDQTKTSAVFPTAGDNFNSTNTDVLGAVQVGTKVKFPNGGTAVLMFTDILPGPTHDMPGATVPSKGTFQVGNVIAFTGKLTFPLGTLSDAQLKRDITLVSHLDNGLNLYRYRYLWSGQQFVGVMAQEVAEIVPDAVTRGPDGWLRVDYARLGLKLQTWDEWQASRQEQTSAPTRQN
jgi:hypothetical protein